MRKGLMFAASAAGIAMMLIGNRTAPSGKRAASDGEDPWAATAAVSGGEARIPEPQRKPGSPLNPPGQEKLS